MKKLIGMGVLALGIGLTACNGGGGGGTPATAAESFVNNLTYSDAYNSYHLVKDPTSAGPGYIVVSENGTTWAVDINSAWRNTYTNDLSFFIGESFKVWYDGNGYYTDIWGNLYEDSSANSAKDLEKVGAIMEKARVQNIGEQLAANYGLSETRGIEVAKLLVDYKTLQKKRSLTDSDADAFSGKLLGFSLTDAMKAYKKSSEGDATDMNKLVEEAARTNETSPEHLRDLLSGVLEN